MVIRGILALPVIVGKLAWLAYLIISIESVKESLHSMIPNSCQLNGTIQRGDK